MLWKPLSLIGATTACMINECLSCGDPIERHEVWPEDVHPFTGREINVLLLAFHHAGPMARTKRNRAIYDTLGPKLKALASEWP